MTISLAKSLSKLRIPVPVSMGGTGGTTQSAARTGLGLGSAAVANIVGTVSQSGGVPTGSIIETSTNTNGTFIKYADGTMICHRTATFPNIAMTSLLGSIYYYGGALAGSPYASTFVSLPSVTLSLSGPGGQVVWAALVAVGTVSSGPVIYPVSAFSTTTTVTVLQIAIGRWF